MTKNITSQGHVFGRTRPGTGAKTPSMFRSPRNTGTQSFARYPIQRATSLFDWI